MTGPAIKKRRTIREQVLAVLREADGPMKRAAIAACLGKNSEDIGSALCLLVAEGLIVRVGTGRYSVPAPLPAPDAAAEIDPLAVERVARVLAASRACSALEAAARPVGDRHLIKLIDLVQQQLSRLLSDRPEAAAE